MKPLGAVRLCLCASAFLAVTSLPVHSQVVSQTRSTATQTSIPDQITQPVDSSRAQVLPNHLPLWANAANDLGQAEGDLTLTMVLARSASQEAELEQLLADQKNPASPRFHHWLTPVEFGQRFGLSDNDLQAVRSWIEAQGMTVKWIAPSRTFIGFGGPAATVGRAFLTTVHNYRVHGDTRTSVSTAPMIPAALAPAVKSVFGLYTIPDKPASSVTAPETAGPELTLSNGRNYVTPADFDTIYDLFQGGVLRIYPTIGIVARSRTDSADFLNFMSVADSSFQMPTEVVPTAFGGVDPGPALTAPPTGNISVGEQLETTLDVTRAGSVANGASLLIVTATAASGGIEADAQYMVQTSPVPVQVMNISFGDCESDAGASGVQFWDSLFQQAATEGISVFVSSGDSGASGCEASFAAPLVSPPAISPNYICSSSFATCVGGTEFNDAASPGAYWNSSYGTNLGTAKSYIPEGGWNEPTDSSGAAQVASSGGGVSSVIATPSWQTGTGVPAARAGRYTPDISFTSSCHDAYFGCMAAAGGDCVVTNGSFRFVGMCGTSAAAPSMAGVAALVDLNMPAYPVGNVNPDIYAMAQSQPSLFHDATPSTSGVAACDANTPSMCNNSTPSSGGGAQAGYALTAGYDLVTGLGSVDINAFVRGFTIGLPAPTITVTPSVTTIAAAQPMSFTVQAAGASGEPAPSGTVTFSSWDYGPVTATLANGQTTFTIPAGELPGSLAPTIFSAEYIPDSGSVANYARGSGQCTVNVTLLLPTMTMTFSPANTTTSQDLMIAVKVDGGSGNPAATGTVTIGDFVGTTSEYSTSGTISGGFANFDIPAGVMPSGTNMISTNYTPDNTGGKFYANASASQYVTIAQAPKTTPSISVTLSASTIGFGDSVTITAKIGSGSPIATGTVTLTVNGVSQGFNLVGGSAQLSPYPGALIVGTNVLAIAYSGDSNYNVASANTTVTVNKANPSLLLVPDSSPIYTAQALSVIITVNGASGAVAPTGALTLSTGSYTSPSAQVAQPNRVITIPAGTLATGSDTISVAYSGDSNYVPGTGSISVSVLAPTFTVAATPLTINAPGALSGNTSTVSLTPLGGFTGSVTLAASLTSSPAGAQDPPTFSYGATSPAVISSSNQVIATLTVSTTAPSTGALVPLNPPGSRWLPLGETALAGVLLFGFRVRRRWRTLLGSALLLLAFCGGVLACGGGGSSSNPPPVTNPGTTPGTYTVSITGTSGATSISTMLTVVVQ